NLEAAAAAVDDAAEVVAEATTHLAHAATVDGRISVEQLDRHQVLGYDLAHTASAIEGCRVMVRYGEHGEYESMLARAFVADALADLQSKVLGRDSVCGVEAADRAATVPFVETHRAPQSLEQIAAELPRRGTGPSHLPE